MVLEAAGWGCMSREWFEQTDICCVVIYLQRERLLAKRELIAVADVLHQ